MISSSDSVPPTTEALTLSITTRDAQFIAALIAMGSTLLNPHATDSMAEHNMDSLEELFFVHYSGDEANALKRRVIDMLPLDGPLIMTTLAPMPLSTSSLVS